MNKTCCACEKLLPVEAFTRSSSSDDGLSSKCRACQRAYRISKGFQKPDGWERKTTDMLEYMRQWRAANPDKVRRYESARPNRPDRERRKYERKMKRLRGEQYVVGAPENRRLGELSDADKRIRSNARKTARRAVAKGKLVRWPCESCGSADSEMHHVAYDRPLLVVWLCDKHHKEVHAC